MEIVLLIENEPEVREIVARVLRSRNYEVIESASLAEGRIVLNRRQESINIVVSDINLGDGNGRDLFSEVKNDILKKHRIGWVAMTGFAEHVDIEYFISHGVTVIRKPFTRDQLIEAIRRAILNDLLDSTP